MSEISTCFGKFAAQQNYGLWEVGGIGHSCRHTVAIVDKDANGLSVVDSVDIQGANHNQVEQRVRSLLNRTGFKEVAPA